MILGAKEHIIRVLGLREYLYGASHIIVLGKIPFAKNILK